MLLAIIAGIVCIVMGVIMYIPKMRKESFYKPLSFLFLFEGIWILLDYIFRQIFPDNVFMQALHYIGLVVLCIYFFVSVFFTGNRHEKNEVKKSLLRKSKK